MSPETGRVNFLIQYSSHSQLEMSKFSTKPNQDIRIGMILV